MSEQERYVAIKKSLTENGSFIYAGTLLARAARLFPTTTAVIIDEQHKISYHELFQAA